MLDPTIRDSIVAELRTAYPGRTAEAAAHAVVFQLGLLGRRDMGSDHPQLKAMATAIVTGVPF